MSRLLLLGVAMAAAAACVGSGLWLAALGTWMQALWLIIVGYGVVGGIGLGLGYITPVSTLISSRSRKQMPLSIFVSSGYR